MAVPKESVEAAYQRYARKYDRAVKLYRLIDLHLERYRERAVEQLRLKPGDCVLDLGCGTGLSFPLLIQHIGAEGRLIGVDLSSEMLACAQGRIDRAGWSNVELVESDIVEYDFPENVNGVLSTGVFEYPPLQTKAQTHVATNRNQRVLQKVQYHARASVIVSS